ncbi:MAG TPA: toxin-antitoxin system protein [Actinomycetota bacterium]|jgi:predicted transcriptional regulator|nr:toxin-antitoxin system protein [Actinomycetota bacterium]
MASTTVRVTDHTHALLRELAEATGEPLQQILEQAVEQYRRERFFAELHAAYERLAADRVAWRDELAERTELDGTLADGLGDM